MKTKMSSTCQPRDYEKSQWEDDKVSRRAKPCEQITIVESANRDANVTQVEK